MLYFGNTQLNWDNIYIIFFLWKWSHHKMRHNKEWKNTATNNCFETSKYKHSVIFATHLHWSVTTQIDNNHKTVPRGAVIFRDKEQSIHWNHLLNLWTSTDFLYFFFAFFQELECIALPKEDHCSLWHCSYCNSLNAWYSESFQWKLLFCKHLLLKNNIMIIEINETYMSWIEWTNCKNWTRKVT